MDREIEELRLEFEITRRELDEMAEEIADAEERMNALARQDVQVGDLREMLDEARARFEEAIADRRPSQVH